MVNLQREAWGLVPKEGEADAGWAKSNPVTRSWEQVFSSVRSGECLTFWLPYFSIALTL